MTIYNRNFTDVYNGIQRLFYLKNTFIENSKKFIFSTLSV